MSKVLLDLDTLVVRPRIAIDGESYEILSPSELSVLESHALGAKSKRMDELAELPKLSKKDGAELKGVVREISDTIMRPVPAKVRAKLSDAHRLSVVQAFSTLLLKTKATAVAALINSLKDSESKTGERTSPASSASTGGRRTGGSAGRRSRS